MITIYKLTSPGNERVIYAQEKRTADVMSNYFEGVQVEEIEVPDHNEVMEMMAKIENKE